ncbi:MAG: glycoside hydrolase family 3 N-terminal domain-containing protein [Gemmatimonadota bacterium]
MPHLRQFARGLSKRPVWLLLVLFALPACGVVPFVGGGSVEPPEQEGETVPSEGATEEGDSTAAPSQAEVEALLDELSAESRRAGGADEDEADAGVEEPEEPLAEAVPEEQPAQDRAAAWADESLAGLTLREKVGQLMMPWVLGDYAPDGTPSHERIVRMIEDHGVGGVIMSVGTPTEVAAKLNDLQEHARLPLLVAADLETGAGFRMRGAVHTPGTIDLGGATDFPTLMAVGATGSPRLAYQMGRVTALEARALGVHVPFAPVLDVNNNPDNPIINVRAFGEDPAEVSRMGAAFVSGVQDHGAIATGKHFPGHGDTDVDSHIALPVIRHDRARMDSVELRPFQAAIDAGMGAIMTAHISVPTLNGGDTDPATLSPYVLGTLLRDEMGFGGLVFTDAMDMSAIARGRSAAEAAVLAIEAGADVILMPASVPAAIDGIVGAVESGRIAEDRIDYSVRRLLRTKASLGLDTLRTIPLDGLKHVVGIPEHTQLAEHIAERSITVLKNERDILPLRGTRTARVLSVTYRRSNDILAGRTFNAQVRSVYPRLSTVDLDRDAGPERYAALWRQVSNNALVVVSTYVTAVSYQGSVAIPEELADFIGRLSDAGVPHVVVSFGNPYLIRDFPSAQAYMLAWSGAQASQRAAARALFGNFEISGRVPTRIPPLFEIGDGLTIGARVRNASDG